MKLLVTAGNTQVPIDRVRCITNIFTGRTGGRIAAVAHQRGHAVTVLTSHPEVLAEMQPSATERWTVLSYRTFDELEAKLAAVISSGGLDAIIHSAAVSDYRAAGIFAPAPDTRFDPEAHCWQGSPPRLADMAAGKVKSDAPELWLRLVRTPKLIDRIRTDWGFAGVLVKFKLEVGVSEEQLLQVAERSRRHSAADLMVANTLEGASAWAYLGPLEAGYRRVSRRELAGRLLDAVESRHREKSHG
jgi:phosphopantothenate-cysteine ligase/phosphopantothenoylcysteine decarboxylase/phosphopantothenate--cysteine ligase